MKTTSTIASLATGAAIVLAMATSVQGAGKTVKFGSNFLGATLAANTSYYTPSQGGSCDFYTTGRADGMVFYKSYNLASGSANFRINAGSTGGSASGYLKVGSSTIARWNKTTAGSTDFSTSPFTVERTAGLDLVVVDLSAGISAKIQAQGKITCLTNRVGKGYKGFVPTTVVTASCGPSAEVAVIGRGYIDLGLAWGGLSGEVTLCKLGVNATATMTPSTVPTELNTSIVNYAMNFRAETLSGKLTAWGDSTFNPGAPIRKTWSYTGLTSTTNLGSGSFKLKKQPILN